VAELDADIVGSGWAVVILGLGEGDGCTVVGWIDGEDVSSTEATGDVFHVDGGTEEDNGTEIDCCVEDGSGIEDGSCIENDIVVAKGVGSIAVEGGVTPETVPTSVMVGTSDDGWIPGTTLNATLWAAHERGAVP
jgi:hypothetical protein